MIENEMVLELFGEKLFISDGKIVILEILTHNELWFRRFQNFKKEHQLFSGEWVINRTTGSWVGVVSEKDMSKLNELASVKK